jgi:hypothetical protein
MKEQHTKEIDFMKVMKFTSAVYSISGRFI